MNQRLFNRLDTFCQNHGSPIPNSGAKRWVSSDEVDKDFMKHSLHKINTSFSNLKTICAYEFDGKTYFCLVGFDSLELPNDDVNIVERELSSGILITILDEQPIRPNAHVDEIVNIVGSAEENGIIEYDGHDYSEIRKLFPKIQIFSIDDCLDNDQIWLYFFSFCVLECSEANSWIDDDLKDTLQVICSLEIPEVPYDTLCRSIFDTDPGSLFMALYRCLEGLYAYKHCKNLANTLRININWPKLSVLLEKDLNWRPNEFQGLANLLRRGSCIDHKYALEAMSHAVSHELQNDNIKLAEKAAKEIYNLRNCLVHFRPTHQQSMDYSKVDWAQLCAAMAGNICHIYSDINKEEQSQNLVTNGS